MTSAEIQAVSEERKKTIMKNQMIRILALTLCLAAVLFTASACGKSPAADLGDIVYVEIDMEDGGYIKLELYPNIAPITVSNFVALCDKNFYDGTIFHRVISGFMIQGGDPTGTGMGGAEETIKGEFTSNGVQNSLSHERGVISMARAKDPNSASSQFFIVHQTSPHLDGQYASFGRVIEGMETVDNIASVATDANDKPLADQTIRTIRVITETEAKTEGAAPLPIETAAK